MRTVALAALAPLATIFPAAPASAQQTDSQLWLAANVIVPLSPRTNLTLEEIGRFSDRSGGYFHEEFGGQIARTLPGGIEIAAGYRHVQDWNQGMRLANEERMRETVSVPFARLFVGRLRLEQRFNSNGGPVGWRVRPRLQFTLPIGRSGLALFATQEHFINLNDAAWGQISGYERMRNAVGFTIPLSRRIRSDIGYLNQYRFGRNGARDQMDNAATMTLTLVLKR